MSTLPLVICVKYRTISKPDQRTSRVQRGITLPNNDIIKVAMFADDTTCFYAKDEKSIRMIKEMTD
jgi:hypothetical protein